MNFLPGWAPGSAVAHRFPTGEYKDREADGSNLTIYNGFKNFDIGDPHPERLIIAGVSWQSDNSSAERAISTMTIGGVTVSVRVTQQETGFSNPLGCSLVTAAVPSGSTAEPVVTMDGGCLYCSVAMFRTLDILDPSPHGTDGDLSDPISMSLNIPGNGLGIAYGQSVGGGGDFTFSGITERFDVTDLSTGQFGGALDSSMNEETGRTVSISDSGSPSGMVGVCGSWR